ncbi:hypothetical protein ABIE26_001608 [Pedobacter africanus]|uniref:Uncharacterized protein n=1 Tax=Pedobacter africanus TaxID=151894 RepID=A0ACC6KRC8_9SPHI|nr:IPT/TIG domain-containing protein [Pedobacter africanus]MDR6781903.1 hypothetical protein [Pedobacter africanus]
MLLITCKKDSEPVPVDPAATVPDLRLEQALTSKDNGLTLNLKVNRVPDSLIEYGFLIGKDSTFRTKVVLAKSFRQGPALTVGELTVTVGYGLANDSLYYVTPYSVKSNFSRRYYNVKSFVWKGDRPIRIDSLYPLKGILGDTLTLRGRQFAESFVSVKFGERTAAVVTRTDSLMTVIVPADLKEMNPVVTLHNNGRIDTISQDFVLNAPKISHFTAVGTFRDTVTINGENFSRFSEGNVVRFGNALAKVASFSKTKLRVVVPDDIELSRTTLTVAAQLQVASGEEPFVIRKPELTVVPGTGMSYQEIILKGKYFHPQVSRNGVTFENNAATILGGNSSELRMRIPFAPYPKRTARVVLKLLDYEVSYPQDLALSEKWILVGYGKPFRGYTNSSVFMLNNVPYVMAHSLDFLDNKLYLWKFDANALSWQRFDIPFNNEVSAPCVATAGGRAYVYTGGVVNSLWQYEPSENRWTKKADYPATVRLRGTMFAIGDNVYLGMGFNNGLGSFIIPDNSFYKYNTINNTWTKETDYPTEFGNGERKGPSSFVIGDKAYIACGATNTGMKQFYSYHPATRSWTKLADFPHPRLETTAFTYGGYGFVATGLSMIGGEQDCFRYDVAADRWESLPDRIGPQPVGAPTQIERGYSFVVGGRAFVGGGNSSTGINTLFMIDLPVLLGQGN